MSNERAITSPKTPSERASSTSIIILDRILGRNHNPTPELSAILGATIQLLLVTLNLQNGTEPLRLRSRVARSAKLALIRTSGVASISVRIPQRRWILNAENRLGSGRGSDIPQERGTKVGFVILRILVEAFAIFEHGKVEFVKECFGEWCGVFLANKHGESPLGHQIVGVLGHVTDEGEFVLFGQAEAGLVGSSDHLGIYQF